MLSNGGDSQSSLNVSGSTTFPNILNDNYGNYDGTQTGGNNYLPSPPLPASTPKNNPGGFTQAQLDILNNLKSQSLNQ